MRVLSCRRVPVAAGVTLGTDVYLPDGSGRFPAVLIRTPYNRTGQQATAATFVARGYACIVQDVRGRYDSDGPVLALINEANDGHQTIDWIANQTWCNGKVGLWGLSYLSIVQIPAASGQHEALMCITPSVSPGSMFRDWIRHDGCLALANVVRWPLTHASCLNQPPLAHVDWHELWRLPTLAAIEEKVGCISQSLRDWVQHDTYDDYWRSLDQDLMLDKIAVPALHTAGWYDHISRNQFHSYQAIRDRGATPEARRNQHLLVGPWGHTTVLAPGDKQRRYGEWDFGSAAQFDVLNYHLQFLDQHLQDRNAFSSQPRVKVFVMGANRWEHFDDWPVPSMTPETWHLDSVGSALHADGGGGLSRETPSRDGADEYKYDPANPVPTLGGPIYWGLQGDYDPATSGGVLGPVDQRPILSRADVLTYRSAPLDKPLTIIGDVNVSLTFASDAEDTDLIAKLCVEESDGGIRPIALGSLRLRYRDNQWSTPHALPRDTPVRVSLQLGQTAYQFATGTRIVLTITSSDFPRILPHANTMAPSWTEQHPRIATHHVLHGPGQPSTVTLPVVAL